jgi:hypothetical protein
MDNKSNSSKHSAKHIPEKPPKQTHKQTLNPSSSLSTKNSPKHSSNLPPNHSHTPSPGHSSNLSPNHSPQPSADEALKCWGYEDNVATKQLKKTYQCWWLALLEIIRKSGNLESVFKDGSPVYSFYKNYYEQHKTLNVGPDDIGKLGPNIKLLKYQPQTDNNMKNDSNEEHKSDDNKSEGDKKKGCLVLDTTSPCESDDEWKTMKQESVYGPQWQKMIMFFLLSSPGWSSPRASAPPVEERIKRLETLLADLGVTGISLRGPYYIGPEMNETVTSLSDGQFVLMDKPKHCMPGIVLRQGSKFQICGYNQSNGECFTVSEKEEKQKNMSKKKEGNKKIVLKIDGDGDSAELNFLLPVVVTNKDAKL